jgi:hypothetical protein
MEEQSTQKNVSPKEPVAKVEAPQAEKDLSTQIERAVEREPLDQVKCVRVFGNYYRCNWWARSIASQAKKDNIQWGGSLMDCIRKSRFLSVTMRGAELVIEEVGSLATQQKTER